MVRGFQARKPIPHWLYFVKYNWLSSFLIIHFITLIRTFYILSSTSVFCMDSVLAHIFQFFGTRLSYFSQLLKKYIKELIGEMFSGSNSTQDLKLTTISVRPNIIQNFMSSIELLMIIRTTFVFWTPSFLDRKHNHSPRWSVLFPAMPFQV